MTSYCKIAYWMRNEHHYHQLFASGGELSGHPIIISTCFPRAAVPWWEGCLLPQLLEQQAKLTACNFSLCSVAPHPASSSNLTLSFCWWMCAGDWQLFPAVGSCVRGEGMCLLLWELGRGDGGRGTLLGGVLPWHSEHFLVFIPDTPCKSVWCSEAKRSFVTVWPGSPWMKTSSQPLIVTNYISLCLCNSHCSNLIQSVLGSRNQAGAQDLHSPPCILGNPTSQSAPDTD